MAVRYSTVGNATIQFPYRFSPLMIHVNESIHKILTSDEGRARLTELQVHTELFSEWLQSHPDYEPTKVFADGQ